LGFPIRNFVAGALANARQRRRREVAAEAAEQTDGVPAETPAVALALQLLAQIADDPLIRGSYRAAARRHLRDLERAAAG
jgi:hypothetical protein